MKKKTKFDPLPYRLSDEELKQMSKDQLINYYLKIKNELRETEARLLLAETMIDVAEEQFGISIRKNSTLSGPKDQ